MLIQSEEKKLWTEEKTSNEWKKENLKIIINRMKGWQLETFKESYEHKKKEGISLFKKKLLENHQRSFFIESISLK